MDKMGRYTDIIYFEIPLIQQLYLPPNVIPSLKLYTAY